MSVQKRREKAVRRRAWIIQLRAWRSPHWQEWADLVLGEMSPEAAWVEIERRHPEVVAR